MFENHEEDELVQRIKRELYALPKGCKLERFPVQEGKKTRYVAQITQPSLEEAIWLFAFACSPTSMVEALETLLKRIE